jgi:stage IV sporulation protein FB
VNGGTNPIVVLARIMRWSFKLARIAGIDVCIHVTFFLLLAFIGLSAYATGGLAGAVQGVVFVSLVFLCVLLHEFGHALAARRYGIRTPDITLLPIGGVARLERMPEKPSQELVVAIAGPLVNVAIAILLLPFVRAQVDPRVFQHVEVGLLTKLFVANVVLVLFNMIPAFPMDGGRVLRAFLAMRLDYAKATNIAAAIGQGLAFAGGLYGLLHGLPMLVLVAIFVYFGAQNEAAFAQMKSASANLRLQSAMVTQFSTLPLHATLNDAVEVLLGTSQHDFPVLGPAGEVRGLLTRDDLITALRKTGVETPVAEVMRVDVPSLHYTMLFDRAWALLNESGLPALPVLDSAGRLVGLFTPENVGELLMVHDALAAAPGGSRSRRRSTPPPLPV